jgi:4-diphosphocytidyl-2-C-methyl-D-erythritol kinase
MLVFPPAKINLGLRILRKRSDGYHDLETCFFSVPGCSDALEMLPTEQDSLKVHRADWSGEPEKNLVWKAMQLFRKYEPALPPLEWNLLKNIPSGAGLGGGSSDAAWALRLMAKFCDWPPDDSRLHEMAASLGSDCAFFLLDGPAIGSGRGEVLQAIELDLSGLEIRLIFPGIHISTADAFAQVVPKNHELPLRQILQKPVSEWKELLTNDFEDSLFPRYPELAAAKEKLYHDGAVYASMSGSGSALFGLFEI